MHLYGFEPVRNEDPEGDPMSDPKTGGMEEPGS